MINIKVKYNNKRIYEIIISGHANYDNYGKDIVCAAVSAAAITTVNNINSLEETIDHKSDSGLLIIRVLKETEINQKLLDNLICQLEELKDQYPENIEIREALR